jgi:hypothetical protein
VLRDITRLLSKWPIALATCFVLAGLMLLPALGVSGLWEPQERQIADRVAPPLDVIPKPVVTPAPKGDDDCLRVAPKDAAARTLTPRAIEFGRDYLGDDDNGRRLPLALLGLVTLLAAAGTAMRGGGGRAGIVTAVVLLAMPLMTLQSRMLTSEIGTACGASLIVFGLVGLAKLSRRDAMWLALDAALCVIALVAGLAIAFLGGGALLGLLVPIGAVGAAGSLGVPFFVDAVKGRPFLRHLPAVFATLAAIGLVALLAYQLFQLKEPVPPIAPGTREVLGKAIVPDGCWSSALGAIWRPDDELRFIFDSTFEQIAYGSFPWGIVAPIAMFALLRSGDQNHRMIGGVTLAWAGGAWIASEVFQRKAGFTIYAGFPALAIAVGVWLDSLLDRRARDDRDAMPGGAMLIGLFVALAVLDLGKDMQSFTDKLMSIFVSDTVTYPAQARLIVPMKLWVLILGMMAGLGFSVSMIVWRPGTDPQSRGMQRIANIAVAIAFGATVVLGAFWSFVWQPRLSDHLSSKGLFETFNELRSGNEPIVIQGDLGQAPHAYSDATPELLPSRDQVVTALKRPGRVFAITPQAELCPLHREMGDKPYFVVDDRNLRSLLISNRVDGTTDKNPLAEMIAHKEPKSFQHKPKARIVYDNKIELLGWDMPDHVDRGSSFDVVTYYKILAPVGGNWTMLMHFDGPLRLRDGDHKPIKDRCPTSTWQPGDYIIDRHTMSTSGGGFPTGRYELWLGFFTGTAPNFKNMAVSAAPQDQRDTADRVKITTITLD